jgi:signal transduction histidine kinase
MDAQNLDRDRLLRLLEAGRSLVSDLDLDPLLYRLLDAARELTGAAYAAIGILDARRERLERFLTAGVDDATRRKIGDLPTGRGVLGELIREPQPLRLHDVASHPRSSGFPDGHPPMHTFLGVPIVIRGRPWGNLYLSEKAGGADFDADDEESLVVLAEWAAIGIENARSVAEDRLRHSIAAAEEERRRWARELHDETLQAFGALQLVLTDALENDEPAMLRRAVSRALAQMENEADGLRRLIAELRPAALDDIGLVAAIETLAERTDDVHVELDLQRTGRRLDRELESTVYRIVQEALTNAGKHAQGATVRVALRESDAAVEVDITDDGGGFDASEPTNGFGLAGMRERAQLAGGELAVDAEPGRGTRIRARLPLYTSTSRFSSA